jgi:hypothetical protein
MLGAEGAGMRRLTHETGRRDQALSASPLHQTIGPLISRVSFWRMASVKSA